MELRFVFGVSVKKRGFREKELSRGHKVHKVRRIFIKKELYRTLAVRTRGVIECKNQIPTLKKNNFRGGVCLTIVFGHSLFSLGYNPAPGGGSVYPGVVCSGGYTECPESPRPVLSGNKTERGHIVGNNGKKANQAGVPNQQKLEETTDKLIYQGGEGGLK